MIALAFHLLAGRYHATGWDHHVNEGTVEWPPSPWRVLRALVAASYRLGPDIERDRVRGLVERLTGLPTYRLPPAAAGHTRHYMPTRGEGTTRVFDAFYAVDRTPGEIAVIWPEVQLDGDERALLARLADEIGYLGRAESWVQACVHDAPPDSEPAITARPVRDDEDAPHTARLLAALPRHEYRLWRDGYLAALDAKQRAKVHLPQDLWDILNLETGGLFREGWSNPPGTRWATYALSGDPLEPARAPRPPARAPRAAPDTARLVLDSAVYPRIEKALWVGEKLRSALLAHVGDVPSPSLVGRGGDDLPARGHRHAYFLPEADGDGFIRHILVHAPGGFDPAALRALRSIRELHGLTSHTAYTTLVALGRVSDLGPHPQLGASVAWESLTPFVPPLCPKVRHGQPVDTPEDQIRWLCREVLGQEPTSVVPFTAEEHRRQRLQWFKRDRRRGARVPGQAHGLGFRLRFAEPVAGPIALGYGAHFGLGQFAATR